MKDMVNSMNPVKSKNKPLICGLLGRTLGHSFSPQIHGMLAGERYSYGLFEVEPEKLAEFLTGGEYDALNVTIPYKQAVMPYLTGISDRARRIGAVNTVLRCPDGTLFGDNTDYDGFLYIVRRSGIVIKGKKVLVIGSGGTSRTVAAVLEDLGAGSITVLTHKKNTKEGRAEYRDTDVIVNTTPVGMYPGNGSSPVPLTEFPRLSGVLDVIFNPARSALLLEAETRGIPFIGGLGMLVAQAKRASELFAGGQIPDSEIERIADKIAFETSDLVLVGMPGCGKSTVGRACAAALGRIFLDTDEMIAEKTGKTPEEIIRTMGEEEFRRVEHECVKDAGKSTAAVIATGGGTVTRPENYAPLHQNGRIVHLKRNPSELAREGRPLSKGNLDALWEKRRPMYESFADVEIQVQPTPEETVKRILEWYNA